MTYDRGRPPVSITFGHKLWSWRWQALLAAVLAAAAVYFGATRILGPVVTADIVTRGNVVRTLVASGHVETPNRVEVGSQITGVVARVLADEGQSVAAGDTLITLDSKEAEANVGQARSAVAAADARLRQIRDMTLPMAQQSLAQVKATLLNARQQFERISKLQDKGYATRVQLENAQQAVDVAEAQVRSAQFQVAANTPDGSDTKIAEFALAQAQASLSMAQTKLDYAIIRSPTNAVVLTRSVESGAVVQPGKVLFVLSPNGETRLVAQVDEKNLGLLAVSQQALASADAFPAETFKAQVAFVSPDVDAQRGSLTVKLRVPQAPSYLRQDMTVSIDVEVERRQQTLLAPLEAVYDIDKAEPYVFAISNGKLARQTVKLGLRGGGQVEILKGVAEGDLLLPRANAKMRPGQRVRVQAK